MTALLASMAVLCMSGDAPHIVRDPLEIGLPDQAGRTVALRDLRGHVIVVYFMTTWLPSSASGLRSLSMIHRELHDRGLDVVAVTIEPSTTARFRRYLADEWVSFPVVSDSRRVVSARYGVTHLPTTFVYDQLGQLRISTRGGDALSTPDFVRELRALLDRPSGPWTEQLDQRVGSGPGPGN